MQRRSEPEWRLFLESLALAYSLTGLEADRCQRGWSEECKAGQSPCGRTTNRPPCGLMRRRQGFQPVQLLRSLAPALALVEMSCDFPSARVKLGQKLESLVLLHELHVRLVTT